MPRPMRLAAGLSTCIIAFALHLAAQEQGGESAPLDPVTKWKVVNFTLFVIAVAWFLWKYAPRFFNARSADIQKAIQDATGLKLEADYRYSEMDRKMATLGEQVKKMREQALVEWQREQQRLREEAEIEIGHIRHNVAAEIEAFRLDGRRRVRRHTARLALELAERRLRNRFAETEPEYLLDNFIHLVDRGKN